MNKKTNKFLSLLCLMLLCLGCKVTKSSNDASKNSRSKADYIISSKLESKLKGKAYILFAIGDKWYYIISKENNIIQEYFITIGSNDKIKYNSKILKKPELWLVNAFNSDLYNKEYIDLNSEFYKNGYIVSSGNTTYFYYKDEDGKIFGESKLTTIINPNPIDSKLYNYLLVKALPK